MGFLKLYLPIQGFAQLWLAMALIFYQDKVLTDLDVQLEASKNKKCPPDLLPIIRTLLAVAGAAHFGFGSLNVLSWFARSENRFKIAVANMFFLGSVAYIEDKKYPIKGGAPPQLMVFLGCLVVGLILHAFEPGLFTADKAAAAAAATKKK